MTGTEKNSQHNYNRWFLELLEIKRPDMVEYVKMNEHEGVDYITIEIPAPIGQEGSMILSTYGMELTMFYAGHHAHFDMFEEEDSKVSFDDFFEYVDSFLQEKLVAISYLESGRVILSRSAASTEIIDAIEGQQINVRSWKGTYSRKI